MYLFWDLETTGLDPDKHEILTAFFCVCDKSLNIVDELFLKLKPESGQYEDMASVRKSEKIHGIKIEEHLADKQTITYKEGAKKLLSFLEQNAVSKDNKRKRKLICCGHNIVFDEKFLLKKLLTYSQWSNFVTNRKIDTFFITAFLKDLNLIPQELGSLESLSSFFQLHFYKAHDAREDVLMNIKVYKAIKKLMVDSLSINLNHTNILFNDEKKDNKYLSYKKSNVYKELEKLQLLDILER